MQTTIVGPFVIAGHVYHATIEYGYPNGDFVYNVVATACLGRWEMSDTPTGDTWLDSQIAKAVERELGL